MGSSKKKTGLNSNKLSAFQYIKQNYMFYLFLAPGSRSIFWTQIS